MQQIACDSVTVVSEKQYVDASGDFVETTKVSESIRDENTDKQSINYKNSMINNKKKDSRYQK